ncbi:MAG: cysteine desulfurase [Woeseia sp.]
MSERQARLPDARNEVFDISNCRSDFPTLGQRVNDHAMVFLDSAASSQQPAIVIDTIAEYQRHDHANVHRGVYTLSNRATEAYEGARDRIARFIKARSRREVVYTSGTTESINLVAQSFCRPNLKPGDKILITHLEHHSNIVPWQIVCEQTGAGLLVAPIDQRGQVEADALIAMLDDQVKMLAIAHVSNALGSILPLARIVAEAHDRDIPVIVDGAQAVPHMPVDLQALDCDFYAFSGHKMFGPTGIGILFGKEAHLEKMPPYQGGGDMILEVRFEGTTYNDIPYKFEAGTPNISGAVGLGATVDYLRSLGMDRVAAYENELLGYLTSQLESVDGIRLFGTAERKASLQSFLLDDIHPHDLGTVLDHHGVAVRTGHHCAMPVMDFYGIAGTARASLALYNNRPDIDALIDGLGKAKEIFSA